MGDLIERPFARLELTERPSLHPAQEAKIEACRMAGAATANP
jgi:hypothetical protein